jgi:hypothetical protein
VPPGRRSLSDEVPKNSQGEHERLEWASLEHIGSSFINAEYKRKKKLLLRIIDELGVSLFVPFLCAHLNKFVVVGGYEHLMTLFGVQIDTKVAEVIEDKRSEEVTNLGKHVKMGDLQVTNLRDNGNWRGNPGPQTLEESFAFQKFLEECLRSKAKRMS